MICNGEQSDIRNQLLSSGLSVVSRYLFGGHKQTPSSHQYWAMQDQCMATTG